MTGDDIHRMGLAQVAELHGQLDPLLRAEGFTRGTVGERINALNVDARNLYPNTDEGRTALLAYLDEVLADIRPRLPRMFNTLPRADLRINRVPAAIESGAPGGYYQGAPLDNSRPGTACAYQSGQTVIAALRAEAERRMGARFDIKAFHDSVLNGGAMPLTVLQQRVRASLA